MRCIDKAPLLSQVELALNILDGAPFREDPKQVIRVQRAKFEQKGHDYVPKKKPKSKKKVAGVLSKQEKELGWGGFDDKLAANKVKPCTAYWPASSQVDLMTKWLQTRSNLLNCALHMGCMYNVRQGIWLLPPEFVFNRRTLDGAITRLGILVRLACRVCIITMALCVKLCVITINFGCTICVITSSLHALELLMWHLPDR